MRNPSQAKSKNYMTILPMTTTIRVLALAGSISLLATANSQAAFANLPSPTNETPGVALDPNTLGLTGTVLAILDSPFVDNAAPTPFATGTLRTLVVDRDPTAAVALDFYYQLINSTTGVGAFPDDSEFYRLKTTGGFDPSLIIGVGQTNALTGLSAGPGSGFVPGSYTTGATLKPAATGDRDVGSLGSVGFDFPIQGPLPFTGDPRNIAPGQTSSFLVVRTNSTVFGQVDPGSGAPSARRPSSRARSAPTACVPRR